MVKWVFMYSCLKVKVVSKKTKHGYLQLGTECYGGGIWHTWFDRDLTLAGRVLVNKDGQIHHKLVDLKRPLLRIPNLAIHLDRTTNDKFSPNKETHLAPIFALAVKDQLLASADDKHHPLLIELISKELSCDAADIADVELSLVDTQPAVLGGLNEEFIFGARLDNQVGAYCAIKSIIASSTLGLADEV